MNYRQIRFCNCLYKSLSLSSHVFIRICWYLAQFGSAALNKHVGLYCVGNRTSFLIIIYVRLVVTFVFDAFCSEFNIIKLEIVVIMFLYTQYGCTVRMNFTREATFHCYGNARSQFCSSLPCDDIFWQLYFIYKTFFKMTKWVYYVTQVVNSLCFVKLQLGLLYLKDQGFPYQFILCTAMILLLPKLYLRNLLTCVCMN